MFRKIVVLGMIFAFINCGLAQNSADSLLNEAKKLVKKEKYSNAFDLATSAIQSYYKQEEWDLAQGGLQFITNLPYEADGVNKFSAFIAKESLKLKPSNPIEAANLISFLGAWHAKNGQYESALVGYETAANDLLALQDTQYLHLIYYRIGQLKQFGQSNGSEALIYAEQAERIYIKKKNQTQRFEGRLHYLRGVAYRSMDWKKSIFHYKKSQELKGDPHGALEIEITKSLLDLGRYNDAYTSAKRASEKFLTQYQSENGEFLIYESLALHNLGRFEEAISTIEKAAKIMENDYLPSDPNYIKVFYYKALILSNAGNYDDALNNCQKVYTLSLPAYRVTSNTEIPEVDGISPNQWVLNTLIQQCKILIQQFKKTQDTKYLDLAQITGQKSIRDIESRRQKMENWESKEQYNDFLYEAYEQALYASSLLYMSQPSTKNKNNVLSNLNNSKATLLQDKQIDKKKRNNIPSEILNEENLYITSIVDLETKILKEHSDKNTSKATDMKNRLFDKRLELEDFKKKNHQFYSISTSRDDEYSVEEKVKMLTPETLVLAYQLYQNHIITIAFNKDDFHLDIIPKDSSFDDTLIRMCKTLSDWNNTLSQQTASEESIIKDSKNISSYLLRLVSEFHNQVNNIVIMPDGILHSIPFELLHIPQSEIRMVDQYDLSYAYLFSSLPDTSSIANQTTTFAGFAPKYSKKLEEKQKEDANLIAMRSGLIDIPEARKTTLELANRYDGEYWINEKATKSQFINNASNYDILHLGMHSLLNDHTNSLSSLVFYGDEENELYLNEIQSMNIPASLVVLSACNTGVGSNVIGEGPLSLARSFFYAGTQTTLMSLWQVPDEQTSKIMRLFYKNLELGLNKSKALADAKREYLTTASKLESHPAFWSGFVLVGDTKSLNIQPRQLINFTMIKYILGLLIILMISFFFGKKLRNLFRK